MSLLVQVTHVLEEQRIRHALIGAAALAVHGVSRSTADVDLLTLDTRVLEKGLWEGLAARGVTIRPLKGDHDDPLAGTVRLSAGTELVDVVVGKLDWQGEIVECATHRRLASGLQHHAPAPVTGAADPRGVRGSVCLPPGASGAFRDANHGWHGKLGNGQDPIFEVRLKRGDPHSLSAAPADGARS